MKLGWIRTAVMAVAAVSMTACIQMKVDTTINADGSAVVKLDMDATKLVEMAKGMGGDNNKANEFTCAGLKAKDEKMKDAECKDVAPGHMIITQKMSKDKVKVKVDGDTYTVDALALFGNSTGKDSPFAEGKKMEAQQVQMMKSMGVVMEMNVTMPGKVTKVDGKAYTGKEGPIKVDLLEVAATGKTTYLIESKGGSSLMTYLLIGGAVLAVLLIIGGVVLATRKKA